MAEKDLPSTVVVKVGSLTLADEQGNMDPVFLSGFVSQLAAQHRAGRRIVLVTSGAVRTGVERLALRTDHPLSVSDKQAAAAVGQGLLMERYTALFEEHGLIAAQVLLTRDIINYRQKYLNARNTLMRLLELGVVPVINENDTVAVDEIKFGDNDALSAIAAMLIEADLLVLLSDVDGLYDSDPRNNPDARPIREVHEVDAGIVAAARGTRGGGGTGGMTTKVQAARQAMAAGIRTIVAHGRTPDIVQKTISGDFPGTVFIPRDNGLTSRKKWLAFGITPEGRIIINQGARDKIVSAGTSLLPVGIVAVEGRFGAGANVEIVDEQHHAVARGLSNYSADDVNKIKGIHSEKIEQILGYKISDDVVHRDNMAVV
jgi:glutamate 5-kinase